MRALTAASVTILISHAAFSQSTAARPEFEVADVQISKSVDAKPAKGGLLPGGRVDIPNVTLKTLIMGAYSVHDNMVTQGPAWLDSDRFNIVAKAPPGASDADLLLMLQSLLADRFKLTIHREDKVLPVYALVVGKHGSKLQETATPGKRSCKWQPVSNGMIQRRCTDITMAVLATQMPNWGMAGVDLPVANLTDLTGSYDIQLEWSAPGRERRGDAGKAGDAPAAAEPAGSTIFDAVQQLGLKLEPRKLPMPVIVIDHVERVPTAN